MRWFPVLDGGFCYRPSWPWLAPIVKRLVALGRKKDVLPIVVRFAKQPSTSAWEIEQILKAYGADLEPATVVRLRKKAKDNR